jgi:hypothetical protein
MPSANMLMNLVSIFTKALLLVHSKFVSAARYKDTLLKPYIAFLKRLPMAPQIKF